MKGRISPLLRRILNDPEASKQFQQALIDRSKKNRI
jgi:hypothetical protein